MPGKRLPYFPQTVRAKTATPDLVTEPREAQELRPGVEVAFGAEVVTVVEATPEPEGVWVELSTGDMGYCDYGAKYQAVIL